MCPSNNAREIVDCFACIQPGSTLPCSFGYKPFLQSIQTQSKQLQSLVQENPPRSRMSLPKRLSIISVDGSLPTDPIPSPKAESCDGSDSEKRPSLEDGAPENSLDEDSAVVRRYECVVS